MCCHQNRVNTKMSRIKCRLQPPPPTHSPPPIQENCTYSQFCTWSGFVVTKYARENCLYACSHPLRLCVYLSFTRNFKAKTEIKWGTKIPVERTTSLSPLFFVCYECMDVCAYFKLRGGWGGLVDVRCYHSSHIFVGKLEWRRGFVLICQLHWAQCSRTTVPNPTQHFTIVRSKEITYLFSSFPSSSYSSPTFIHLPRHSTPISVHRTISSVYQWALCWCNFINWRRQQQ